MTLSNVAELRSVPTLYRIGSLPEPFAWPPPEKLAWPNEHRDRFDDPDRKVRVLYASESEYGCALEIVARFRFRPSGGLLEDAGRYGTGPLPATGIIPASYFRLKALGELSLSLAPGEVFLDLRATQTLTSLRAAIAPTARKAGLHPFELERSDALGRNRRLTQEIARWAIAQGYRGLAYESRWSRDVTNWALFEPLPLEPGPVRELDAHSDPAIARALGALGVELG
ncbi:MAG TPA: RES family NAD+ phosphorylase [Gemmatimonadales bacterium]|nr:RES family NAD+ phosphorylase [Gemmatimonadales bacterium]